MNDKKSELDNMPSPNDNAEQVVDVCAAIVLDVLSLAQLPTNSFALALQNYKRRRIEKGQEILLNELGQGKIDVLSHEKAAAFIPSAYQFFEAARSGEYEHNLRLLAKLLSAELKQINPDYGKLTRHRRILEAMPEDQLAALAFVYKAFEVAQNSPEYDGNHLFIDARALIVEFGEEYSSAANKIASGYLMDFAARGLLFLGANPELIGGQFYYKTTAFDEIIGSAMLLRGEEGRR